MLEALFTSRVRAKLLTTLFMSPGVEQNAWTLAKTLDESYSDIRKELVRLEGMEIATSETKNNTQTYQVNPDCLIAPELRAMILKTDGFGDALRAHFAQLEGIQQVFVYGPYVTGEADEESHLDLMVLGEIEPARFSPIMTQLEKELKRPINYRLCSEAEWQAKIESQEPAAMRVMRFPKVLIMGGENNE